VITKNAFNSSGVRLVAVPLLAAAVFVWAPCVGSTATNPQLTAPVAAQIALGAVQPYVNRSGIPQGGPVTLVNTRLTRVNARLVWIVRLQATLFIFKCNPGPGWQGGTCPETPSQCALVHVADKTSRVLLVEPTTPAHQRDLTPDARTQC